MTIIIKGKQRWSAPAVSDCLGFVTKCRRRRNLETTGIHFSPSRRLEARGQGAVKALYLVIAGTVSLGSHMVGGGARASLDPVFLWDQPLHEGCTSQRLHFLLTFAAWGFQPVNFGGTWTFRRKHPLCNSAELRMKTVKTLCPQGAYGPTGSSGERATIRCLISSGRENHTPRFVYPFIL